MGYNGLDLIEGNLTQVQFTVGGGYTQRVLFQDPVFGEPLITNQLIYDDAQIRWNVKFLQGFGDSPVEGLDLITAYIGYEGRYEKAVNSMKTGELRLRGYADVTTDPKTTGPTAIPTMDAWFGSFGIPNTANFIYPEDKDCAKEGLYIMGRLCVLFGDLKNAEMIFNSILKYYPDHKDAASGVEQIKRISGAK